MKTEFKGISSYVQGGFTRYCVNYSVDSRRFQKRGFKNLAAAKMYLKELEIKYVPSEVTIVSTNVVETYLQNDSIRETAIRHGMSRDKVRKILINEGVYSTPQSIKVNDLLEIGYTTQEVAEELSISVSTVNNLAIYRKGENNVKKNKDHK
ncbi:helix-turn-helix transcriptional regulator [Enterococcus thailandicus]